MQLILHPSHRRAMHRNHIRRQSPAPVTEKVLIPDIKSLFPNWTSSTNQISHWREIYMLSFWIVSQFLLPRLPMRFPLLLVVGGHSTSLSVKACSWYQSPSDSTLTWSSTTGLSSLKRSQEQFNFCFDKQMKKKLREIKRAVCLMCAMRRAAKHAWIPYLYLF